MGFSKTRIDGIVDVGLIVLSHCENPAKLEAIDFIEKVFTGEIRAVIPVSSFIGAYHIMVHYLKINPDEAAKELVDTLSLGTMDVFYEEISIESAVEALLFAREFKVESWDGYIVSLARKFETDAIFTIDKRLTKVKGIKVIVPISEETLSEYHRWLRNRLKRR